MALLLPPLHLPNLKLFVHPCYNNKDMPGRDNIFGRDPTTDGIAEIVESSSTHETNETNETNEGSLSEPPVHSDDEIGNQLTSYSDESEDSRYIPDIDDVSEDPDEVESAISLKLLEEVRHDVLQFNATDDTEISAGQIEAVTNFSTLCKTLGIEIMKQNRRGIWQTRYLTISAEMLNLKHSGDLTRYPEALLWVKRHSPNQSHSLDGLSSDGRGGVEFTEIESVEHAEIHQKSKSGKLKESAQLNLHYRCGEKSRTVPLRFKTKREADYFASSIETIVDVLDHEGIY